ncbi:MAG: alanine racemase [Actinobacteria bacterium]|nr:alanine racemase [Actinomycetota bacterium]
MTGFTKAEIEDRGHPVWAEVDLGAIRHNVGVLRALAPSSEVMAAVKGYAYGHGNPASARAALQGGATRIGVARVGEAIHLRADGIETPIHVFTEPPPEAAGTMIELGLTPAVYTSQFAAALSDAAVAAARTVPIHVKIDTGMHRVGLPPDDVEDALLELRALPGIEVEGIWSHLAVADVPGHPFTSKQLELFEDVDRNLDRSGMRPRYRHIANSAATISMPASHLDLVRCGIACYGLWPGPAFVGSADLRPAMALRARTNMVKSVPAGGALSYGLTYGLERSARVVTVPAGYADGYGRGFSGRASLLINGTRYRVSGTVCMDQFMVDVGDDDVEIGDVATLIGSDGDERIAAEELAGLTGTINYEITTRIPSRVPRVYLNELRLNDGDEVGRDDGERDHGG